MGLHTNSSHQTKIPMMGDAIDRLYHLPTLKYPIVLLFGDCNGESVS